MLSAVERGAKAPTVLVLDRIATGLGTSIARLLGEERSARVVVLRRQDQDVGRDPSGWERRILSPVLRGVEFEFMRTTIAPRVDAGELIGVVPLSVGAIEEGEFVWSDAAGQPDAERDRRRQTGHPKPHSTIPRHARAIIAMRTEPRHVRLQRGFEAYLSPQQIGRIA